MRRALLPPRGDCWERRACAVEAFFRGTGMAACDRLYELPPGTTEETVRDSCRYPRCWADALRGVRG